MNRSIFQFTDIATATVPQKFLQTPLHHEKFTDWCGLHAGGIIGPYFFKNEGNRVTVNGDRCCTMIIVFLFKIWRTSSLTKCGFNRMGLPVTQRMKPSFFWDKVWRYNYLKKWARQLTSKRCCDLTPLDYFLWGYTKSKVYAEKPAAVNDLESRDQYDAHYAGNFSSNVGKSIPKLDLQDPVSEEQLRWTVDTW